MINIIIGFIVGIVIFNVGFIFGLWFASNKIHELERLLKDKQ